VGQEKQSEWSEMQARRARGSDRNEAKRMKIFEESEEQTEARGLRTELQRSPVRRGARKSSQIKYPRDEWSENSSDGESDQEHNQQDSKLLLRSKCVQRILDTSLTKVTETEGDVVIPMSEVMMMPFICSCRNKK